MAEDKCYKLLKENNKPYNVQGVSDMLASQGVKKTQAEKALMALAEAGKIVCKEFGKTKVFFATQEGLAQMDPGEKTAALSRIKDLGEACKNEEATVATLRRDLASANSTLTVPELQERVSDLLRDASALEEKLNVLRNGATLVSAADVARIQAECVRMVDAWGRRKRSFRAVWDAVSENVDGKQSDIFEDMGVESDEAAGVLLAEYQKLVGPTTKKRARG
jgi:26S proteasome regulatory subunit, ATPase 3, interacting protein